MVFGNRDADSGTGVLFTRNPSTGERALYGDILFDAQGEEVVAGGRSTHPLAELDERLPAVAAELRRHAQLLERHYGDLCDIEFTIEHGRLWILQVRVGKRSPQAALRMAIEMATESDFPCSREEAVRRVAGQLADPPRVFVHDKPLPPAIANGLPASPGVAAGSVVTSSDAAEAASAEGRPVILVRPETSPDDVRGMAVAVGILTSRGGLASHAAVVARGWGIPAVVGAESVRVGHDMLEIDGRTLRIGEWITIDGGSGEVYLGELAGHWETAPQAATLLEWAAELGIEPGAHREIAVGDEVPDARRAAGTLSQDDLLRALLVKGNVPTDQLAGALRTTSDDVEPLAAPLVAQGLLESMDGMLRLTDEGKLSALAAFAADRSAVGEPKTEELLDAFHTLDRRVKGIVTAWQMRVVDGEQTLNDHTDASYDAGVLEDLNTLHADAVAWLASLSAILPRFEAYAGRLAGALELAQGGDQRFVASPRVDSYHGVWFELHEDLIRVAGRRRADEAAGGRA
jgi:pyruvate,orthophosphate dikinase